MRKIALVGFAIWLGATVALRLFGQFVFRDSGVASSLVILLVSAPVMFFVARSVLAGIPSNERARAAIALVSPGMLLDTFSTIWFARVFPNIRADAAAVFGGWLLFCNVVVLLTVVLWPASSVSKRDAAPLTVPAEP